MLFLSTPSARRATCDVRNPLKLRQISIHTLREEGDALYDEVGRFQGDFYPRPPRGGRLYSADGGFGVGRISIHALREEGDDVVGQIAGVLPISIHALREEGDFSSHMDANRALNFYPRPPRGGRRGRSSNAQCPSKISIHALREEGDATGIPSSKVLRDFYPRPPRGGRPRQRQQQTEHGKFLSTPSARRATILSSAPRAVDWISIHALREEGDLMWQDT